MVKLWTLGLGPWVAGFLGAVIDPTWFIGEQVLQKDGIATSEGSIVVAWQLGNLYLLLAFIGIAALSTTSENKVVRAYLVALWLGDVGHIGFSCYGIGWGKLVRPVEWNAMAWGNIAMTLFLLLTRTAYFAGLFGADHITVSKTKKKA
ncbi:hypothetical protein BHE90_007991 [Fusarium euwallaceae]|uniref:DUF7704 domain-containing protein n=1 Tax=Fusarium euwallaceae TaxID=1147111 RepID=A0A430LP97_9HYPO|nr:hypothetical protein BHE90_007991 [Fusarium euwallaceae]